MTTGLHLIDAASAAEHDKRPTGPVIGGSGRTIRQRVGHRLVSLGERLGAVPPAPAVLRHDSGA